jgi:hypothetical protein
MTGLRGGAVISAWVVVLAIVGLSSWFSWVPEVPLLLLALLVPVLGYGVVGYRSTSASDLVKDGLLAGAIAGAVSGAVGGLSYVVFGKSLLNAFAGPLIGAGGGALIGAIAGLLAVRIRR